MTYKVSYEDRPLTWTHGRRTVRTETFDNETAALGRARQLLEDDNRYAVSVHGEAGERMAGVRLQLKLGFPVG
jgi:hypothetical protein